MDKELRTRWIEALAGGDSPYRQGQSVLRDDEDRFCCLGVLCDLAQPEAWEQSSGLECGEEGCDCHNDSLWYHELGDMAEGAGDTVLSDAALEKLGLNTEQQQILTRLNDGGFTFQEIARIIAITII